MVVKKFDIEILSGLYVLESPKLKKKKTGFECRSDFLCASVFNILTTVSQTWEKLGERNFICKTIRVYRCVS